MGQQAWLAVRAIASLAGSGQCVRLVAIHRATLDVLSEQAISLALGKRMNDASRALVALEHPHRVLRVRRVEYKAHRRAETAGLITRPACAAVSANLLHVSPP
jgi:hypothetical protein